MAIRYSYLYCICMYVYVTCMTPANQTTDTVSLWFVDEQKTKYVFDALAKTW